MSPPKLITDSGQQVEEEIENLLQDEPIVVFSPPPDAPDWMTFESKMEWIRCAKDLHEKGKLIGGMISLLENYCTLIGYSRELLQMLQEDGKIVGGKPHPAYKMFLDTVNQSRALGSEIGFAKKQIVAAIIEPDDKDDPWKDKSLLA